MKKRIIICLLSITLSLLGCVSVIGESIDETEFEQDVVYAETTNIGSNNLLEIIEDEDEVPQAPLPDNSEAQWVTDSGTVYNYFEAEDLGLIQSDDIMSLASIVDVDLSIEDLTHKNVAAGKNHTLMINQDGDVYAWGENNYGQLGNGTTTNSTLPVKVSNITDVVDVCTGIGFSLALTSSGEVYAWGRNIWGTLGLGNYNNKYVPTKITAFEDIKVVKISAIGYHCMALTENGDVYAWGINSNGQVGTGTGSSTYINTPTLVPNLPAAIDIAAGEYSSLVVDLTGYVWGWGNNYSCQLGIVDSSDFYSPQKTTISGIEYISLGHDHCLAIGASGTVYAWGHNHNGQLGNSKITTYTPQPQELFLENVVEVWAGYEYSLVKTSDINYYLWGRNDLGQLGIGSSEDKIIEPTLLDNTYNFTSVYAEYNCTYAIDSSYNLYRWGYMSNTYYEELTWDAEQLETINVPLDVQLADKFVQIESRRNGSVAVDNFGNVYTWGEGKFYDLGHEQAPDVSYPRKVEGLPKIKMVAKGENHTLALDYDGNVWGWGNNSSYEISPDFLDTVYGPIQIFGVSNIVAISAGEGFSAAITSDGKIMTWGKNHVGQLGYDSNRYPCNPKIIDGIDNVSMISCGESFMTALVGKTIYTWGYNISGQLGDGTTANHSVPTAVEGEYKYVSSQRDYVLAIGYDDNKIYAWGSNTIGQLGTGDKVDRTTPTLLAGDIQYSKVYAGYLHSLAIDTDGYVYGWGAGREGQLGLGNYDSVRTPTKITRLTNAKEITGGGAFSFVLDTNGNLFGFGNNTLGEVGIISNNPEKILDYQFNYQIDIKLTTDCLYLKWQKYMPMEINRIDILDENDNIIATNTIDNINSSTMTLNIPCKLLTGEYTIKILYNDQKIHTITLDAHRISKDFVENESVSIPFIRNNTDFYKKVFTLYFKSDEFELLSENAIGDNNVDIINVDDENVVFKYIGNIFIDEWTGLFNVVNLKSITNKNCDLIFYVYEQY